MWPVIYAENIKTVKYDSRRFSEEERGIQERDSLNLHLVDKTKTFGGIEKCYVTFCKKPLSPRMSYMFRNESLIKA